MRYIWIYWVITVILTILVVVGWRVWWTVQDRDFRRSLPRVVQTEKLEAVVRKSVKENSLPRSFLEDLLGANLGQRHNRY